MISKLKTNRGFLARLCRYALFFSVAFHPSLAFSDSANPGKVIAGWVEKISIGSPAILLKAKLDTGAKTSSIHAENVNVFRKDGERWVRFDLILEDAKGEHQVQTLERRRVRGVRIKNHDGEHDRRSIVSLEFCFDGRSHRSEFTLADRSQFIYPVLLGRQFLEGVAVVDASETFLTQAVCDDSVKAKNDPRKLLSKLR
jgi:hypothetical protein